MASLRSWPWGVWAGSIECVGSTKCTRSVFPFLLFFGGCHGGGETWEDWEVSVITVHYVKPQINNKNIMLGWGGPTGRNQLGKEGYNSSRAAEAAAWRQKLERSPRCCLLVACLLRLLPAFLTQPRPTWDFTAYSGPALLHQLLILKFPLTCHRSIWWKQFLNCVSFFPRVFNLFQIRPN